MNALEFCYSLQGFAELTLSKTPTAQQWAAIKEKLESVEDGAEVQSGGGFTPVIFVAWLVGFVEISDPQKITARQWSVIREHLELIFTKVTTETVESDPFDMKKILDEIEKSKPYQPYPPYIAPGTIDPPWTITCEADQLICSNATQDMYCAGQ